MEYERLDETIDFILKKINLIEKKGVEKINLSQHASIFILRSCIEHITKETN